MLHTDLSSSARIDVQVQRELQELYPNHSTGVIGPFAMNGLPGLAAVVDECRDRTIPLLLGQRPAIIEYWRSVFKQMHASEEDKPSIEYLYLQLLKKQARGEKLNFSGRDTGVPRLYNWVSIASLTPLAAYDMERIEGPLKLRFAKAGEPFITMGTLEPDPTCEGEIIYSDDRKVICRYWNRGDCDETKITRETRQVIFLADIASESDADAQSKLSDIASLLAKGFGQESVQSRIVKG